MTERIPNQKLIERITKWQAEPVFHELTCGNNSRHALLKPVEENNEVVLLCRTCNYKQTHIPELFFDETFDEMYDSQKAAMDALQKRLKGEK